MIWLLNAHFERWFILLFFCTKYNWYFYNFFLQLSFNNLLVNFEHIETWYICVALFSFFETCSHYSADGNNYINTSLTKRVKTTERGYMTHEFVKLTWAVLDAFQWFCNTAKYLNSPSLYSDITIKVSQYYELIFYYLQRVVFLRFIAMLCVFTAGKFYLPKYNIQ